MKSLNNYVDGAWAGSTGRNTISLNPSNNTALFEFPQTPKVEVDFAVASARKAFETWKEVSRVQRADYFDKLAQLVKRDTESLAEMISLETGKNLNESKAEVIETLHMLQYVAGMGRMPCGEVIASELSTKDAYVIRKPKGVVAVISPWNFPCAIGSAWSSAPAIAEGNCVVHKPSELTPGIANLMARLYIEAGFPRGVYNLVNGAEETGKALVESNVDCILFTGSAEVGKQIKQHCAGTWNKTCSCELGSKSAVIVFNDANWNLALEAVIASAFKLSGQRCVSSGRALIQRDIFDKFCHDVVEAAKNVLVADPFTVDYSGFSCGPLISKDQVARVEKFNQLVRDDVEAAVVFDPDGKDGKLVSPGNFLRPFIYTTEWRDAPYLKQEVFGPHLALIPFDDVCDAIRIYNDTEYGLALGVVTEDFRNMRLCRDNCRAGMIYLNGGSVAAESHLPFGGLGKSGNGHKSAAGTYKAVTDEVAVTVNYERNKITWAQGMK